MSMDHAKLVILEKLRYDEVFRDRVVELILKNGVEFPVEGRETLLQEFAPKCKDGEICCHLSCSRGYSQSFLQEGKRHRME